MLCLPCFLFVFCITCVTIHSSLKCKIEIIYTYMFSGHYIVLVGYDSLTDCILYRDPGSRDCNKQLSSLIIKYLHCIFRNMFFQLFVQRVCNILNVHEKRQEQMKMCYFCIQKVPVFETSLLQL